MLYCFYNITIEVVMMQKLEKQFHIACTAEDIGRYCILPGDPGRVPAIAAYFDDAKQVAYNREYTDICSTSGPAPSWGRR